MKKISLIILSITVILTTLIFGTVLAGATTTEFAGGNGTEADPYQIKTKEHLHNVRNHLNSHFEMINDIIFTDEDFSEGGVFYNNGKGWIPIGDLYSPPFSGTFDGNGFAVIGIYSKASNYSGSYTGLFGINKGVIMNLAVADGTITDTSSGYTYVGGIVGINIGTVANCYSSITIRTMTYGGGIAGSNQGMIMDCYNANDIKMSQKYGVVSGGIVGLNNSNGVISTCYNIGNVTANQAGGIVGENHGTVSYCYYLENELKGCGNGSDVGYRCSVEELKNKTTFESFDFENTWEIHSNSDYLFPTLKGISHMTVVSDENMVEFSGGNGSFFSPYLISKTSQLFYVQNYPDACFKLTNNLVFTVDNNSWISIGDKNSPFTGNFDGNGYLIEGLTKSLFDCNKGVVKNIALVKATVNDSATVIRSNYGLLYNCFSASNITFNSTETINVGGLVCINYGNIKDCYYQGDIVSNTNVGGIVGKNQGGTISCCYNLGIISSSKSIGGLVGINNGTISYSYYYEFTPSAVGSGTNQGTKATAEQLKTKSFFVGFDFDSVWTINNSSDYPAPTLRGVYWTPDLTPENTEQFSGGRGNLFDPFLISTKDHIDNIAKYATAHQHFKLINDIVYDDDHSNTIIPSFNGVLEGNSYSIKNFTFKSSGSVANIGFIGKNSGIIRNLKLENCNFTLFEISESTIGTLAAVNSGVISNVHIENNMQINNLIGLDDCTIGGIVGSNKKEIKDSSASGEMKFVCQDGAFDLYIGGIAGSSASVISNTVNKMNINLETRQSIPSTTIDCGGVVGYSYKSTKNKVRNEGNINFYGISSEYGTVTFYIGGIVGTESQGNTILSSNSGRINADSVTEDMQSLMAIGGILGRTKKGGTVKKSYNAACINAETTYGTLLVGGIAGDIEGSVEDCYNTGNVSSSLTAGELTSANSGGIVGYARTGMTIYRCYNVGKICGGTFGGITGANYDKCTYKNAYYINNIDKGIDNSSDSNIYACSEEQLKQASNFSNFNFDTVWEIDVTSDYYYPTLRNITHIAGKHTYSAEWDDECDLCNEKRTITYTGWVLNENKWYYYQNGTLLKETWILDSTEWRYVGVDGSLETNAWARDSKGWCYLGCDGYIEKNKWLLDSGNWYYLDADGYMVTNKWKKDSKGWVYLGANGTMLINSWCSDSQGWCYLGSDGYMITNDFAKDSSGWCFIGNDGYYVTTTGWKLHKGFWYYLNNGYRAINVWKKDSKGWCYLGADGKMVTNDYVYDSIGKCYLDANGYWNGKYVK